MAKNKSELFWPRDGVRDGVRDVVKVGLTLSALALSIMPALSAPVGFQQGIADYNSGNYARALSIFQSFKASYPNNALVHYYTALSQQGLGHIEQAKSEYQWVVNSRDPKLAGQAAAGLAQLSRAHTTGAAGGASSSGSHQPTSMPPPGGSVGQQAPRGKVSKVLDFWASW